MPVTDVWAGSADGRSCFQNVSICPRDHNSICCQGWRDSQGIENHRPHHHRHSWKGIYPKRTRDISRLFQSFSFAIRRRKWWCISPYFFQVLRPIIFFLAKKYDFFHAVYQAFFLTPAKITEAQNISGVKNWDFEQTEPKMLKKNHSDLILCWK